MRSKVWKRMSEILLILIFISIFILLELRIIQKPYKWIVFDVTRNKYTTYDKDNDSIIYETDARYKYCCSQFLCLAFI